MLVVRLLFVIEVWFVNLEGLASIESESLVMKNRGQSAFFSPRWTAIFDLVNSLKNRSKNSNAFYIISFFTK